MDVLRCDCKEQLEYSKQYIQEHSGILIYLPQEGRGIGLANKIHAYSVQEDLKLDTVDSNRHLGFEDDYRTYEAVTGILKDLNIKSVALLTNNPRKIHEMKKNGVKICQRLPIIMTPKQYNSSYLEAKLSRMDHL